MKSNNQVIVAFPLVVIMGLVLFVSPAQAQQAEVLPNAQETSAVTIRGELNENESINISGIDGDRSLLLIGADEGDKIQVLKYESTRTYIFNPEDVIDLQAGGEVDIEAVAWGKKYAYVIGSHSRKRKKVKSDKTAVENLERLYTTGIEPPRENLYRLELNEAGKVKSRKQVSLHDIFANDKLFRPFQVIPSKENGIDIEGLAVDPEERLYVGFRGPVLRGNYVPVMVLEANKKFKQKSLSYNIRFINTEGRGIRGLESVSNGFLVLAGPVGSGSISYRLYFWDGKSCVGGKDVPNAGNHIKALCEIPTPAGAKAEGIHLVEESASRYRFLIVYDGLPQGGITEFACM